MRQPKANWSLFLMLLTCTATAFALPSDKDQVIHVQADRADLSQAKQQGVYSGNVQFSQGTTTIQAAKAITKISKQNKLTLALVYGNKAQPAHYWTQTQDNQPPVHAFADCIRYYPQQHLIELEGNARIVQGKNSFASAKISYDTLSQHVLSQRVGKTRTSIIIYPDRTNPLTLGKKTA